MGGLPVNVPCGCVKNTLHKILRLRMALSTAEAGAAAVAVTPAVATLTTLPVSATTRVDALLSSALSISRSKAQSIIKDRGLIVNGVVVTKVSTKVKPNDSVTVTDSTVDSALAPVVQPSVEAEDLSLEILYADDDVAVVNKSRGMVVHPSPEANAHFSGTLVNGLLHEFGLSGLSTAESEGGIRPGIVHRLDKDTSGVMVVARNDAAHAHLKAQFAVHSVSRKYVAVVCGHVRDDNGTVDAPIGRHPANRKLRAVLEGAVVSSSGGVRGEEVDDDDSVDTESVASTAGESATTDDGRWNSDDDDSSWGGKGSKGKAKGRAKGKGKAKGKNKGKGRGRRGDWSDDEYDDNNRNTNDSSNSNNSNTPKSNKNSSNKSSTKESKGPWAQSAVTHYTVTGRYGSPATGQGFSTVECVLETGRTHQVRVHMKHLGHVLVNDTEYNYKSRSGGKRSCALSTAVTDVLAAHEAEGQLLHAAELAFDHPAAPGRRLSFSSPPPPPFQAVLDVLHASASEGESGGDGGGESGGDGGDGGCDGGHGNGPGGLEHVLGRRRVFVFPFHREIPPDFNLNNLQDARVDSIARCISSSFFLSNGFRRHTIVYALFLMNDPPVTVEFDGAAVRHLRLEEKGMALLLQRVLFPQTYAELSEAKQIKIAKSLVGVRVRPELGSLAAVLERFAKDEEQYKVYMMSPDGGHVAAEFAAATTSLRPNQDAVFVIGDYQGYMEDEMELLEGYSISGLLTKLSLGSTLLLASHTAVILHHYLDVLEDVGYGRGYADCGAA